MKMRALAIRVVAVAFVFGAIALLVPPDQNPWEVVGFLAIWILSDVPESRAWQALSEDEREAVGPESGGRTIAKYVVLFLLLGIGVFVVRIRHLSGANAFLVSTIMPVSVFVVGTSLLTWRRIKHVRLPLAYRRAFLLSGVLQMVVLGLALWIGARQ